MLTSTTKSMLVHMGGVPVGAGYFPVPYYDGQVWFVDGTNGSDGYDGKSLAGAKATIQAAVDLTHVGDTVLILPKELTQTSSDPTSYAETVIVDTPSLSLIGVSRGRTQGGLPQIKIGAGTTAMLDIRAPGCYVGNLGFNGGDSTGGGIRLTDDGGTTYAAYGTTIENCHFKNCKCHATNGGLGGAIYWGSGGGAWQVLIRGNRFYKNVADIVLPAGAGTIPQDVVIEGNIFSGPAASVDVNIYTGTGGIDGLIIRNNVFSAIPALSSGSNTNFLVLTDSVGIVCFNAFACEDGRTFGAAGDETVPTTMFLAGNFSEKAAAEVANGDSVYRT